LHGTQMPQAGRCHWKEGVRPEFRRWLVAACLCLALSLAMCVAGCRRSSDPTVVLYVLADEQVARRGIDAVEKQTGPRGLMVGDTEVKKTSGLVERLRSEREHPQADVFWSSEVFMTIDLASDGVLDAYESPGTKNWPKEYCDAKGRWYGFAARARVIAYSP